MAIAIRNVRPLITLFGTIALIAPFCIKIEKIPTTPAERIITRRLDIARDDSDPLAEATLSVISEANPPPAVVKDDHEKVSKILSETRELIRNAKSVYEQDGHEEAHKMVNAATAKFKEAKEHMAVKKMGADKEKSSLRAEEKRAEANKEQVREDEDRALDISRNMYETFITFPECLEKKFSDCLALINGDLQNLGLSTVEIVVHEKRNANQEGYNKVVIVTNDDATRVTGRIGDGIVSYPFTWDDSILGTRQLGVDGKWNCRDLTPEECCDTVKDSAKNPDTKGNYIACHIFVPFGGVKNARRNDRVFINLSPDGRVHEPPHIS